MTLTFEQFKSLRDQGLSVDQIIRFERGEVPQGFVQQPPGSGLDKISKGLDVVFGGGKIGEAIGAGAAKLGLTGLTSEERKNVSFPSAGSVIGDIGQVGLTLGTLGGAGTGGKLGIQALKSAALGGGFGLAESLKQEQGFGETSRNVALGGGVGAALPLAGRAVSQLSKLATENLPKSIIESLIPSKKDITQHVLQNTKLGSTQSIISNAQRSAFGLNEQIEKILSGKYKTVFVNKKDLLKSVALSYGQSGGGGTINSSEVQKVLNKVAPQARGLLSRETLTIQNANKLRKILDRTLGDRAFQTSQLPFTKDVLFTFSNFLRNHVQNVAKETAPLFEKESKEITLIKGLAKTKPGLRLNLYDILGGFGGLVSGGPLGGIGGVVAERTARSPAAKIGVAKGLTKLGQVPFSKVTPLARTAILKGTTKETLDDRFSQ